MNDNELDDLLKSAAVPGRDEDYWREFPKQVTRALGRPVPAAARIPARPLKPHWLAAWGVGFATACIVLGAVWWANRGSDAGEAQLAQARKCYAEIEALFPNQVQAIVFDRQGPRMILAPSANVPDSPPFYLKICDAGGCERMITFSGQEVQVSGQTYEVLADAKGQVMLVGNDRVLAGDNPADPVRIQSRALAAL